MTAVALIVALVALVLGALCSATDAAILTEMEEAGGSDAEGVTGGRRNQMHRALAITRLLMNLTAGLAGAVGLRLGTRPRHVEVGLAVLIALVVLIFSELAPRAAGAALGPRGRRALYAPVVILQTLVRPLTTTGAALDRLLRRALPPMRPRDADRDITADQFRRVVQAGADVRADQRAILHRVFSLGDTEVHEVMVPRVDIIGIESGTPWSEALDRVRSSEHSRLPVFTETLDHITGILFAKDLLPPVISGSEPPDGWESLVRPATFIPESKTIDAQLRDFKSASAHIAIVVDEFGGTAGLITIEDILEEIVGDIRDEHDTEEAAIRSEDGCRFWVSGRVTLDDLSDALGHTFEHEGVSTVGGLVFELLGHVPRAGEELHLEGFRVVVERVVRRRVDRLYFERHGTAAERVS